MLMFHTNDVIGHLDLHSIFSHTKVPVRNSFRLVASLLDFNYGYFSVIVTAGEPECSANVLETQKFAVVQIYCDITYVGYWRPEFSCLPEAQHQRQQVFELGANAYTITYVYNAKITHNFQNNSLRCDLKFTQTNNALHNFTPPVYNYEWKSPPVLFRRKYK
jgi:hypothetical protein